MPRLVGIATLQKTLAEHGRQVSFDELFRTGETKDYSKLSSAPEAKSAEAQDGIAQPLLARAWPNGGDELANIGRQMLEELPPIRSKLPPIRPGTGPAGRLRPGTFTSL